MPRTPSDEPDAEDEDDSPHEYLYLKKTLQLTPFSAIATQLELETGKSVSPRALEFVFRKAMQKVRDRLAERGIHCRADLEPDLRPSDDPLASLAPMRERSRRGF